MGGFLAREDLFVVGCSGTSTLSRGVTLLARWFQNELLPYLNLSVGLGFHTLRGGIDSGVSVFVQGCWSCKCTEEVMIRGWYHIMLGCGGTSICLGGKLSPRTGTMSPSQISNQSLGVGIPHLAGRYRPRGCLFSSPGRWSYKCMEILMIGGWELIVPRCGGTSPLPR